MNKTDLLLPRGHGRNAFDGFLQHYRDARRDYKVGKGSFGEIFKTQNGLMVYLETFKMVGRRLDPTLLGANKHLAESVQI